MVVFSNPASPEVEDEYNRWYDEDHLPLVRSAPGVVGATRYRLDGDPRHAPEHRYLAVYEIDGPVQDALSHIRSVRDPAPALDAAGTRVTFWTPLDPA